MEAKTVEDPTPHPPRIENVPPLAVVVVILNRTFTHWFDSPTQRLDLLFTNLASCDSDAQSPKIIKKKGDLFVFFVVECSACTL